jgi:hypothetical protein
LDCNARCKNRFENAVATSNPKAIGVVPFKKSKIQSRRLNNGFVGLCQKKRFSGLMNIQSAPAANERRSIIFPSSKLSPSNNKSR